MASVRAARAGNWSDTNPTTSPWGWSGVLYPPTSADDVFANNFAITIDQNVTVLSLSNASASSRTWKDGGTAAITAVASSGYFTVNTDGITITANASSGNVQSSCIRFTAASPAVLTFTGNANSGGGSSSPDGAIDNQSTGTININGANITGSNYTGCGVLASGAGTINLNTCTISGSGNAPNGSSHLAFGVLLSNANATCNFNTCTINSGSGSWYNVGVGSSSTGVMNFTNCTINGGTTAPAISNRSAGTLTITSSTVTALNGANAIVVSTSSTNRISANLVSSPNGSDPIGVYSTNGNLAIRYILNTAPTQSYIQRALDGTNASSFVRFYTADNTGFGPATNHVRAGVTYSGMTGTLAVPLPSQVSVGVPTDNTVGTAALTPSDIWNTLTSSMTTSGSIGERLKNCATTQSTGDQLASLL